MKNNNDNKKKINRRNFLKIAGTVAAGTTAALYSCKPKNTVSAEGGAIGEVPTDKPKMSISTLIHQKMVDFCRINAQYYAYYKRITNAIF